jgi:hypothetical protein
VLHRSNVVCRYDRAAAVLQARASLVGGTHSFLSRDAVTLRAICAAQVCAFMTDLAPVTPIDIQAPNNSSTPPPTLQQRLHHSIDSSCLLEPDRSCRCCPASALPPLSRAVDALPLTYWMSPPLRQGSFFGLDFLMPVRLRSVVVDVGHAFHSSLLVEVLHSLGDAWLPLQCTPQVSRPIPSKGGSGSGGSGSGSTRTPVITRFTYNLEPELRDLWRLQVRSRRLHAIPFL